MKKQLSETYSKIYDAIKCIPYGKVATYGQIAEVAGLQGQARLVGYALFSLPEDMDIPWHRVINAKGEISGLPDPDWRNIQKGLLEAEDIQFNKDGRVDLKVYRW
ncbi:MGMT family protein [candidate division KSB1 bacterium]|nr:MGMT family protein [candidate division KSB1 bacterium]